MKRIINYISDFEGWIGMLEDGTVVSSLIPDKALKLAESGIKKKQVVFDDAVNRKNDAVEYESQARMKLEMAKTLRDALEKEAAFAKADSK